MFIDPKSVIDKVKNLRDLMIVADFGSSTGDYTLEIAKRMQGDGRVYALEVQKNLLDSLAGRAIEQGLGNIFTVWTDLEKVGAAKVPEHSVNVAIIANVLFQIDDKDSFGTEVKRLLAPHAQILIVDWNDSFGGLGPQPEQIFNSEKAVMWCEHHGFTVNSLESSTNHHYVIMASN